MHHNVTVRRGRTNIVAVENSVSVTYYECVLVSSCIQNLMQHAPYCALWLSWPYNIFFSPYYLINGHDFRKMSLNTKCVLWFSLQILSEIFFSLWRIKRDIVINVYWPWCKVTVILVRLEWNFNYLDKSWDLVGRAS